MAKLFRTPKTEGDWHRLAGRLVRIHMTVRGWRFAELAAALERIGVPQDEVVLRNRIGRSRFSAALFLQCMRAMDIEELILPAGDGDDGPRQDGA